MARTQIVIEVESKDDTYLKVLGETLVGVARDFIRETARMARATDVKPTIIHDGKEVTEVIQ